MNGRKLATIRKISKVSLIEGADRIVTYHIDGWKVIDTKDKYLEGELVVYLEVDSWVPHCIAPFLSKGKEPKEYKGVQGERLKTIKLRGQFSQGLLLPLDVVHSAVCSDNSLGYSCEDSALLTHYPSDYEGMDVSELLGVQKWEPPLEFTHADTKGCFPSFIPKSNQERIQNCYKNIKELLMQEEWEITEKLEGQSHTCYFYNGVFGVCSRNLELKDTEGSTFWNTARKYDLENILRQDGRNLMIQSEQVGPGIQGNIYRLNEHKLFIYDIFLIDEQRYMTCDERYDFCNKYEILEHVPVLCYGYSGFSNPTCDELIVMADGTSELNSVKREGIVFKMMSKQRVSFKVISNQYLLKQDK